MLASHHHVRGVRDDRRALWERTAIIANTSNMPVMAREASIYTAMTVAEYFRDQELDVVLIADLILRWAEALRGSPHATASSQPRRGTRQLCRRHSLPSMSAPGGCARSPAEKDQVTVIAAVSPPGGDFTEPVSAHTQRFVRTVWTLDRDLAYAVCTIPR